MAQCKKRRTAKQIAATRKLVALNKRRARKRNPVKKARAVKRRVCETRTARVPKKKVLRGVNPASLHVVVTIRNKNRLYYDGSGFSKFKGNAARYQSVKQAEKIAHLLADTLDRQMMVVTA